MKYVQKEGAESGLRFNYESNASNASRVFGSRNAFVCKKIWDIFITNFFLCKFCLVVSFFKRKKERKYIYIYYSYQHFLIKKIYYVKCNYYIFIFIFHPHTI